ncbi:MAG: dihydroorotase [halophilic archaeon J07HX64]|jgi:dihydroorotase, multifunctional complex type|nr:MAG: dihydroorotase [halophilic archaeon J07HX64]
MHIRNATLADGRQRDVRVVGERIQSVAESVETREGERVVDATGKRLLPGMVDMHVHLRQPGFGHKETWRTGTRSAAAGGVTTVVDQPNTDPPTVDGTAFDRKRGFADDATVDFGLNGGVTGSWDPDSLFDRPLCALGEVFLADSTGEMGIDEALFVEALECADGLPVTVHAEDESLFEEAARERSDADAWSAYRRADAEIAATRRACRLAAERDRRIHIAHASTPESVDAAARAGSTCEVTPHHILLSRRDLGDLGTHGRMNPPLRRERHRRKLFDRVADGTVDVVATDHAPHTREEKATGIWEAPSGVPGVETALPLLLGEARQGRLGFDRIRDLTARNPAAILGLPEKGTITAGTHADLVLVDPAATGEIRATDLHTSCEWTPFEGHEAVFPEWTMCRGQVLYRRETDEFEPLQGENVRRQRGGS